jgi:hypothetical protein
VPDSWQRLRAQIAVTERFSPHDHEKLNRLRAELAFVRTRNRIMRLAETLTPAQQRDVIDLLVEKRHSSRNGAAPPAASPDGAPAA